MMAPVLRVIDADFNFCAYITNYESLWFERSLFDIGKFKLQVMLDVPGAAELLESRIIILGDGYAAGIIEEPLKTQNENGRILAVSGIQLKGITGQRLTVPAQIHESQYFGYDRYPDMYAPDAPAESVLKHYIYAHMINPDHPARSFPRLTLAPDQLRGIPMRWSSRFEELQKTLKAAGEYCGMGYDILPDLAEKVFVAETIPRRLRGAGGDTPVIFSPAFGNLAQITHSRSIKPWKNTGYAGGAGEDENRLIQIIHESGIVPAGFNRRETWLDCGSMDQIGDLLYEGGYKLAEKKRTESVNGDVLNTGPFVYRRDYDIGDVVTVQSRDLNVSSNLQITAVTEAYEAGKAALSLTFGERPKKLLDEINQTEVIR